MSFTAEVKDELSRVQGECERCDAAQLLALVRVCGTLSFRGTGRYTLRIATETGSVARTSLQLLHRLYDLKTQLTFRRSRLHKTHNFLIEVPEQDELGEALADLGVLEVGHGLVSGVPEHVVERECCRRAFLRGAFMAGGFIADPRGDLHLEMTVTGEDFANGIVDVCRGFGINARLNHRRGAFAVYLKSFDDIVRLLRVLGATRSAHTVSTVKGIKEKKNAINRQTNADMANMVRHTAAAEEQLRLIRRVEREVGLNSLPPALREFCTLRRAHPDLSLAQLGAEASPALSKSAMYHRVLRLQALVNELDAGKDDQ